jgi:uncharacterized protein
MTPAPDRAWRFVHPDLDAPEAVAGLRINPQGGIDMVAGRDSVHQALLLLISTVPGERVMRPGYGCHLHRLLFAPNDDSTAGLAIHYVRRAVEQWEPRIEILHLDAYRDEAHPERLEIVLDYRVRMTRQRGSLAFSLDLMGEEA